MDEIINYFTRSKSFSNSNNFDKTNYFTSSKTFTPSNYFSNSAKFTQTNVFSLSNTLDNRTSVFTSSNTFSPHPTKTPLPENIQQSIGFSLTMVNIRTVTYSYSSVLSNSYILIYNEFDETYELTIIHSYFFINIPYIIISLSPSYSPTYFQIELGKKKGISPEQLIGAVCGSVAVFFIILSVIIFIVQRNKKIMRFINSDILIIQK